MKIETPAEQLSFTTVLVHAEGDDGSWSGTGFIVQKEVSDDKMFPAIITNRHVVEGASKLWVHVHQATPKTGRWRRGRGWRIAIDPTAWVAHPDPRVDVAAIPAGPFLFGSDNKGRRPFYRALGTDLFADADGLAQLDALEDVIFIGYPSGIFDQENNMPIARRGLTATPIALDYEGLPAFLIDASVFPGSSGSPVLLWNMGSYRTRDGGLVVGSRIMLLGVLAAVHVRQVVSSVVPVPAKFAAVFDEPIDLGIVFKTDAINDTLNQLLADFD